MRGKTEKVVYKPVPQIAKVNLKKTMGQKTINSARHPTIVKAMVDLNEENAESS